MEKQKVRISIDVEFLSSNVISGECLQLAFVVFTENLENFILDELSVCFLPQGKQQELSVVEFWSNNQEILERIHSESKPIHNQMQIVKEWLENVYNKYRVLEFVAEPGAVDLPWVRCLYFEHCSSSTFTFPYHCKCVSTMKGILINMGYSWDEIEEYLKTDIYVHTHYALDDAKLTAFRFVKLLEFFRKIPKIDLV